MASTKTEFSSSVKVNKEKFIVNKVGTAYQRQEMIKLEGEGRSERKLAH